MSAKDDGPLVWRLVLLAFLLALAATCLNAACTPPAPPWIQPGDEEPSGPCIVTELEQRGAATIVRCHDGTGRIF